MLVVQLMFNMGNLSERSEEQEEMELREAFKVFDKGIFFRIEFNNKQFNRKVNFSWQWLYYIM